LHNDFLSKNWSGHKAIKSLEAKQEAKAAPKEEEERIVIIFDSFQL
jgi:hypothetical protein